MSIACSGLTHCSKCGSPLRMDEIGLCSSCSEIEKQEQDRIRKEEEKANFKAEIVNEVRDEMLRINASEINIIKSEDIEVTIDVSKPEESTYNDWYADIGYKIVELYKSGLRKVTLKLEGDDNK